MFQLNKKEDKLNNLEQEGAGKSLDGNKEQIRLKNPTKDEYKFIQKTEKEYILEVDKSIGEKLKKVNLGIALADGNYEQIVGGIIKEELGKENFIKDIRQKEKIIQALRKKYKLPEMQEAVNGAIATIGTLNFKEGIKQKCRSLVEKGRQGEVYKKLYKSLVLKFLKKEGFTDKFWQEEQDKILNYLKTREEKLLDAFPGPVKRIIKKIDTSKIINQTENILVKRIEGKVQDLFIKKELSEEYGMVNPRQSELAISAIKIRMDRAEKMTKIKNRKTAEEKNSEIDRELSPEKKQRKRSVIKRIGRGILNFFRRT